MSETFNYADKAKVIHTSFLCLAGGIVSIIYFNQNPKFYEGIVYKKIHTAPHISTNIQAYAGRVPNIPVEYQESWRLYLSKCSIDKLPLENNNLGTNKNCATTFVKVPETIYRNIKEGQQINLQNIKHSKNQ